MAAQAPPQVLAMAPVARRCSGSSSLRSGGRVGAAPSCRVAFTHSLKPQHQWLLQQREHLLYARGCCLLWSSGFTCITSGGSLLGAAGRRRRRGARFRLLHCGVLLCHHDPAYLNQEPCPPGTRHLQAHLPPTSNHTPPISIHRSLQQPTPPTQPRRSHSHPPSQRFAPRCHCTRAAGRSPSRGPRAPLNTLLTIQRNIPKRP